MNDLICNTCDRQYKRQYAFESHIKCCPKLFSMPVSINNDYDIRDDIRDDDIRDDDIHDDDIRHDNTNYLLPSNKVLYQMVIELSNKCNKMQNEIKSLRGIELKEKKKINPIEWLIKHRSIDDTWEQLIQIMESCVHKSHIYQIIEHDLYKTMKSIICDGMVNNNLPIVVFSHKRNCYFIYHESDGWKEYNSTSILRVIYKVIHRKLNGFIIEWTDEKTNNKELFTEKCIQIYNNMMSKFVGGEKDDGLDKIYKRLDSDIRNQSSVDIFAE